MAWLYVLRYALREKNALEHMFVDSSNEHSSNERA